MSDEKNSSLKSSATSLFDSMASEPVKQPALKGMGRVKKTPPKKVVTREEVVVREKLWRSLFAYGLLPMHAADYGPSTYGRPDLYVSNFFGPTVIIEVKCMIYRKVTEPYFMLSQISDPQRQWFDVATITMGATNSCFIAIGTSWRPEQLYIIPWVTWVTFEKAWMNHNQTERVPKNTIDTVFGRLMLESMLPVGEGMWDLEHSVLTTMGLPRKKPTWNPATVWKTKVDYSLRFGKKEKDDSNNPK